MSVDYSCNCKEPVLIAIVDSGIDKTKSDLGKYIVKSTGFRVKDQYIVEDISKEVENEHATAIAMIIRNICHNVSFISVNILNEKLLTDGRIFMYALLKVLECKPDIINLSLGVTKWKYKWPVKNIVKRANNNGTIVVSAANNDGKKSYPAYLKGVLGVKACDNCVYDSYYYKDGFFYAPPGIGGISGKEELENQFACGNSYAAGYITGHVARLISQGIRGYENILKSMVDGGVL